MSVMREARSGFLRHATTALGTSLRARRRSSVAQKRAYRCSTRCARRRARRPVHSTRAPPPRTAPAAKHISSQARDRIAPLTLTWRSSSLYAQLNGRNSRKMPKKSKNKTGAATNASAANKRARRAADEPLLAASNRAADARHPRDAKHGHELCGRFVAVPWAAWAGYKNVYTP